MKNILEKLYYGELCPDMQMKPLLNAYKEKHNNLLEKERDFVNKLDATLKEEFEVFMDKYLDITEVDVSQTFIEGFRLGVQMMCEVFYMDDKSKDKKEEN